jgi:hypothetical protein
MILYYLEEKVLSLHISAVKDKNVMMLACCNNWIRVVAKTDFLFREIRNKCEIWRNLVLKLSRNFVEILPTLMNCT